MMTEDVIWDALARALAGEYDILARLGFGRGDAPVYLARELVTGTLVVLRLPPISAGNDAQEYGLEVVRQIDYTLPAVETRCSHCGRTLHQWARFCTKCGQDISGLAPSTEGRTRDQLLRLAREAAAGRYEVLGEMTRAEGGGLVYFARELDSGRVVGFQLEPDPRAMVMITPTHLDAIEEPVRVEQPRKTTVPRTTKTTKRISVAKRGAVAAAGGTHRLRSVVLQATAAFVVLAVIVMTTCRGARG